MTRLLALTAFLMAVPNASAQTEADAFTEAPDSVAVASGTLYGTLAMPDAAGPVPVALILAGSGPTDRDGNSAAGLHADSYRLLAHALAARGVATLRADKRGVGESAAAYDRSETVVFGDFVSDAQAWLQHLRADPRFASVSVVGHSEGALVGALAGAGGRADALVSVAGAGEPIGDVLRRQLSERLPEPMRPDAFALLDSLEAGRLVPEPGLLAQVFPPAMQPYLISWMAHDPAAAVAAFAGPVLVVQGRTDVQVGVADAERLAAARPEARLVLIDGMNHVLKDVSGDLAAQMPSYADASLPVNADLVREAAGFLLAAPRGE